MEDYAQKLGITLDAWQKEVIETTNSHIAIRAGRQVGKSTVVALKAALYALENRDKLILVIASVDRQSQYLFEKILETILTIDKSQIRKNKDKPTKHYMKLKNGTKIYSLPTGRTGYGIRGLTVDLLIADEAAFIPPDVWVAVAPMLAVTKGHMILLSTPMGKIGYFYDCFSDPNFKTWHVKAKDCPRITKEFLEKQRKRMTKFAYRQEYEADFVEELGRFFTDQLIDQCLSVDSYAQKNHGEYYLGVDIARYGGDESAFVVVEYVTSGVLVLCHVETISEVSTMVTLEKIFELEKRYKFRKIFLDDGGMGAPILDILLKTDHTKRKSFGLNNASRSVERQDKQQFTVGYKKKRLLKEDLYGNLLRLMEHNMIHMVKDNNLRESLASIQIEYDEETNKVKIYGKYSHIAEAAIRAAWCDMSKGLNLFVHGI